MNTTLASALPEAEGFALSLQDKYLIAEFSQKTLYF